MWKDGDISKNNFHFEGVMQNYVAIAETQNYFLVGFGRGIGLFGAVSHSK
jgi:hypothetical protein